MLDFAVLTVAASSDCIGLLRECILNLDDGVVLDIVHYYSIVIIYFFLDIQYSILCDVVLNGTYYVDVVLLAIRCESHDSHVVCFSGMSNACYRTVVVVTIVTNEKN